MRQMICFFLHIQVLRLLTHCRTHTDTKYKHSHTLTRIIKLKYTHTQTSNIFIHTCIHTLTRPLIKTHNCVWRCALCLTLHLGYRHVQLKLCEPLQHTPLHPHNTPGMLRSRSSLKKANPMKRSGISTMTIEREINIDICRLWATKMT